MPKLLAHEYRYQTPTSSSYVRLVHSTDNWEFYRILHYKGAYLLCSPAEGRFALVHGMTPFNTNYPRLVIRRKNMSDNLPTMATENVECEYHRIPYQSFAWGIRCSVYLKGDNILVSDDNGRLVETEWLELFTDIDRNLLIQLIK